MTEERTESEPATSRLPHTRPESGRSYNPEKAGDREGTEAAFEAIERATSHAPHAQKALASLRSALAESERERAVLKQMLDEKLGENRIEALAALEARAQRAEEALELGLDMLDVEHFPWCESLDPNAWPQLDCNCGRTALQHTSKEREG